VFWLKIFAVSFALGVVSGIVMSFQFGTNWSELSNAPATSSAAARVRSAHGFLLEATFLGVMLFGWRRVRRKLHFFATCMVALGTLDLDVLDHRGEQLDAHAAGFRSSTACSSRRTGGTSCSIRRSRSGSRT
jgi:hypothetical protein